MIEPKIFKAYDIRGIYPEQLNEETAYKVGRAYADFMYKEAQKKSLQIVVGSDMRLSSPSLKKGLVRGLLDGGISIIDIGLASSPTFYFAVSYYGYDGGLMVSASHNPKEYNGFKMVREKAIPISGYSGIMEIRDMAISNEFVDRSEKGGIIERNDILSKIVEVQAAGIDVSEVKSLKVVIDTANAMAGLDVREIFKDLPCEVEYLNLELDGTFPAHEADPFKEENLEMLRDAIKERGADLGIATDGDGDRYFFLDETGEMVRPEILRGIMAQIVLSKNPGSKIVYDIRPGKITKDLIVEAGGEPIVARVGHSLIKEKMIQEGALYGGESSGHYFYTFDFGVYEAPVKLVLEFLVYISQAGKPISEITAPHHKYFHSGEINRNVEDKEGKMKEIAEHFSDAEISWLDGVTVEYEDFWFNVRPSNTESLLRLNLEAVSEEVMKEKRELVLQIMEK